MGYVSQLSKRYESDWAKSKARTLLREMIKKHSLDYKKAQNLKVLCFPGIDAAEIFEVYDPLGIPRHNIIGIEREPEISSKLSDMGLGIKVVPSTLDDYLKSQSELDLDVISLDYTGPITSDQLEVLTDIRNKTKKSRFILHHANLMKRDRLSYPLYSTGYGYTDDNKY